MKNVTNYWQKKYERANKRVKKYKDSFSNFKLVLHSVSLEWARQLNEQKEQKNYWRLVAFLSVIALLLKLVL